MAGKDKLAKREQAEVVRREDQAEYYQPAVDIKESPDGVIVQFDMPGVSKNDIDLTVEKGALTVIGRTNEEEYGRAIYRETRVGDYRRQFSLGDNVNTDDIRAEMNDGVLTVKISRAEAAKPRKIAIAGSS